MHPATTSLILGLFLLLTALPLLSARPLMATVVGNIRDSTQNSAEVADLGRFAVAEHNKKQNKLLEFARVVRAREQVVAGTMHHLTVEVVEAGKKQLYEAKVWVKPWMNFKELQEFQGVGDSHAGANA